MCGAGDIAALREATERTASFARKGDLEHDVKADQEFHRNGLNLNGNPVLVDLSQHLRARARMHEFPGVLQSGEFARSAKEDVDLVPSIASGDVAAW